MNLKLKAARDKTGKTQAQVAKESGITERGYRQIEAKNAYGAVQIAIRIARTLGSTVEELFEVRAPKEPEGNPADEN